MPRRTRNGMMWGIAKVCEETSIARSHVEWLMRHGHIKSLIYRGELVTTQKHVESFLDGMFSRPCTIMIDDVPVFEPVHTTISAPNQPTSPQRVSPRASAAVDDVHRQLLADIEKVKNAGKSTPTTRRVRALVKS